MGLRVLAGTAGVLGGVAWVVSGATGTEALYWVGLGLLAVSLAASGAGLVSRSAAWLRAVVAVAVPLLAWSVAALVRDGGDDSTVDLVLGMAAVVLGGLTLVRARPQRTGPAPSHRH